MVQTACNKCNFCISLNLLEIVLSTFNYFITQLVEKIFKGQIIYYIDHTFQYIMIVFLYQICICKPLYSLLKIQCFSLSPHLFVSSAIFFFLIFLSAKQGHTLRIDSFVVVLLYHTPPLHKHRLYDVDTHLITSSFCVD